MVKLSGNAVRAARTAFMGQETNVKSIAGMVQSVRDEIEQSIFHNISICRPPTCPTRCLLDATCSNFYLTTSGNFRTQTLLNAILEVGCDRILFSVDYPFQDIGNATAWFAAASISEPDRLKIGRLNATSLLKLPA